MTAEHARQVMDRNAIIVDGQTQIISMDPIQAAFGLRWPAVNKKVIFIVETLIRGQLAKGESIHRRDGNNFYLVYPSLDMPSGAVKTRSIAENICRKLLGDDFESGKYGENLVGEVANPIRLTRAASTNPAEKVPASVRPPTAANADDEDPRAALSKITIQYDHIFSTRQQMINAFRISARRVRNGMTYFGKHVLFGGTADPLWGDLHARMLEDLREQAARIDGTMPSFILTLSAQSFASDKFYRTLENALKQANLRKHLMIELVDVDDDVEDRFMKNLLSLFANSSREVMVRISPESPLVSNLKVLGVKQIGLNMAHVLQSGLGRRATYVIASGFARKCNDLGLSCYVWDVDAVSDFQLASAAGFSLLSGRVLGTPADTPSSARPLASSYIKNNSL